MVFVDPVRAGAMEDAAVPRHGPEEEAMEGRLRLPSPHSQEPAHRADW